MTTCFSIFERRSSMAREILLCSRLKQNPFLPVRRARRSQSQPYYDDGMITLKVLLKSVYTSQKYYLTMTLQRCIHAYVQYHLLSANTWFSMTNLLRIEKDNISEYCLSSSYFATVPRGFGFLETLVFFYRLSYSSDKNPGDCSFVLIFVNYKDLLYCRIQRLETLSYSVENSSSLSFLFRLWGSTALKA